MEGGAAGSRAGGARLGMGVVMDRTFAEVRAIYEVWARAYGMTQAQGPPQEAYEATRAASQRAASQAMLEARDWKLGQLTDHELYFRLTALILRVTAAAWLQGGAAEREARGEV